MKIGVMFLAYPMSIIHNQMIRVQNYISFQISDILNDK